MCNLPILFILFIFLKKITLIFSSSLAENKRFLLISAANLRNVSIHNFIIYIIMMSIHSQHDEFSFSARMNSINIKLENKGIFLQSFVTFHSSLDIKAQVSK